MSKIQEIKGIQRMRNNLFYQKNQESKKKDTKNSDFEKILREKIEEKEKNRDKGKSNTQRREILEEYKVAVQQTAIVRNKIIKQAEKIEDDKEHDER